MEFIYEILFQLNVRHSFYEDGICKDLLFLPTENCRQLLNAHRINFKPTFNGFVLIAEKTDQAGAPEPVIPIDGNTDFNFFIYLGRKDFLNITDADFDQLKRKKFFFRNTTVDPAVVNGSVTTYTIHNNLPISETLSLASTNFLAPVNIADNPFKLILRDADNNLIIEKIVPRNALNEITIEALVLTTSTLDENIYKLQQVDSIGTVVSEQLYFLTSEIAQPEISGVLQLKYNSVISASASSEFHFNIDLPNRKLKWIYRVEVRESEDTSQNYNPNDIRLNNALTDALNTQAILGTSFTKTLLPGPFAQGTLAIIEFESTNPIDVREEPYKGVMLLEDNGGPPLKLVKNLPNPDPLWLQNAGAPGQFQSQVAIQIK